MDKYFKIAGWKWKFKQSQVWKIKIGKILYLWYMFAL